MATDIKPYIQAKIAQLKRGLSKVDDNAVDYFQQPRVQNVIRNSARQIFGTPPRPISQGLIKAGQVVSGLERASNRYDPMSYAPKPIQWGMDPIGTIRRSTEGTYGKSLQSVGKEGFLPYARAGKQIYNTAKGKNSVMQTLESPDVTTLLDTTDVIPVGAAGGLLLKRAPKVARALKSAKPALKAVNYFDTDNFKVAEKQIPQLKELVVKMDELDYQNMVDLLDLVRIKKVKGKSVIPNSKEAINVEINARRMAEAMGLNPNVPNGQLAKAFDSILTQKRAYENLIRGNVGTGKLKATQAAAGGLAGIEPNRDEQGNITGLKYNPQKGLLGVGLVAGTVQAKSAIQKGKLGEIPVLKEGKQLDNLYQPSSTQKLLDQPVKTLKSQTEELRKASKQEVQAIEDQIIGQRTGLQPKVDTKPLKVSPNSSDSIIPPFVADEVKNVQNAVGKKVNMLDYMRTPDRVLAKMGLKPEADLLKKQYNSYLDQLPVEINKVTEWYNRVGKSDESSQRIFKYLDGQPQQLEGEELKVANEIKTYLADWADKLQLPQDKRVAAYITHIFEADFIRKEFDPDLAKMITDKVPSSVYDPFLQQRLGKLGYKEDVFQALDAYVKRATRKYNMDPALSKLEDASNKLDLESLKYVTRYAEKINLRPSEIDNLLDNMIKSSPVGYKLGQRPVARVSKASRQMVYRGTLGLNVGSALRNLTQGANTYAKLGEKYTGIGYMKTLRSLASKDDELSRVGVLRDQIIQDRSLSATKKFWEKVDKKLFVFFDAAERINRGAAYFGAKAKALDQGLSEQQAIQAGIDTARQTQFTFGSVDTPVALQGDIVKFFTQFMSYNVKQTEFLAEMAKNKEFAGMVRWLGINTVLLYTVGKMMGWDWKDMVPFGETIGGDRPLGQTPPVKFASDLAKMTMGGTGEYGQPVTMQDLGKDVVPFIPAGTQIKKTLEGVGAYNRGYSQSKTGLVRYPIPQTTGNLIKTGLLGQYTTPEAREYFGKKRSPLSEKQSEIFKQKGGVDYYNQAMDRRVKKAETDKRKEELQNPTEPTIIDSLKEKLGIKKAEASTSDDGIIMYDDGDSVATIDYSKFTKPNTESGIAKYKYAEDKINMVQKIFDSEAPEADKMKAIQEMGYTKKDVEYDYISRQTVDVKYPVLQEQIAQKGFKTREEILGFLVEGRTKSLGGKRFVSDDVIDRLYNEGYITTAEKKELKSIKDKKGITLVRDKKAGKKPKKLKYVQPKTVKLSRIDANVPEVKLPKLVDKARRTQSRLVQPISEAEIESLRNPSLK